MFIASAYSAASAATAACMLDGSFALLTDWLPMLCPCSLCWSPAASSHAEEFHCSKMKPGLLPAIQCSRTPASCSASHMTCWKQDCPGGLQCPATLTQAWLSPCQIW